MQDNEELGCIELVYDGKIYRPYCIGESGQLDSIIGYYKESYGENITYMHYVFNLKEQLSDEWLVSIGDDGAGNIDVNGCNMPFVWKEINVTNIPEGIEKETEWSWNN